MPYRLLGAPQGCTLTDMTYLNEPTAHTEQGPVYTVEVKPAHSPRWLQIVRDALLSVAALLFIVGAVWLAVAVNQAGDALSELGDTSSTSEMCTDPNVPWCEPVGD
jgi:hypothetical protein